MTDIQLALLSVGLATPQKINKINRQKAIDESFIRTAQKAVPGASPKIWQKYAYLKRRASKNLQFTY
ncbi:MAG: hypothetical protein A2Z88_00645 [Omnitrophica WOR_2 bacterium GWA2_47_8]|nr:MAG: hypothetical protein A2Z88_00645 [Omnitrophica WOR_2 bacterium GWA2_47_8]